MPETSVPFARHPVKQPFVITPSTAVIASFGCSPLAYFPIAMVVEAFAAAVVIRHYILYISYDFKV